VRRGARNDARGRRDLIIAVAAVVVGSFRRFGRSHSRGRALASMAPRRRLSKRRLLLLALAAVAIAVGATRGAASASTPPPGADADPSAGARASPGARHHRPSPASSSLANERPALARPAAGLADPARALPAL